MDNLTLVQNALITLRVVPGKDCSEYAEELQYMLGSKVNIKTVRAVNNRGCGEQFRINSTIDAGPYYYHTFVTFHSRKEQFVADIFHPMKVVPFSIYVSQLKQINPNKCFIKYNGCFDTFDLMVHTLDKLKAVGIKYTVV